MQLSPSQPTCTLQSITTTVIAINYYLKFIYTYYICVYIYIYIYIYNKLGHSHSTDQENETQRSHHSYHIYLNAIQGAE